jgi:hypothetical protein
MESGIKELISVMEKDITYSDIFKQIHWEMFSNAAKLCLAIEILENESNAKEGSLYSDLL